MAIKGLGPAVFPGPMVYYPSAPFKALQAQLPKATISFNAGTDVAAAARLAAESDLVVVFANQWTAESIDVPDLSLPDNQDALITAVAKANAKTVVVLQTGGPITMPWLDKVGAVLEAWYPGTQGGEAIARVLTGKVNPSGHLPVSFPASLAQVPRPVLDGYPEVKDKRFEVDYFEGAAIGYKWLDLKGHTPLFPFGYGLSYTDFAYSNLQTQFKKGRLSVSFSVKNTGDLAGKDVAQVYVTPSDTQWEAPKRLVAFQKVDLQPGETKQVELVVDSRLLAMYHSKDKTWRQTKGDYQVVLAHSAAEPAVSVKVRLPKQTLDVRGQ
jgi:beta-glucosidase